MDLNLKREILKLYFDPNCPASFSPFKQFYKYVFDNGILPKKFTKKQLKNFLLEFVPSMTVNRDQQLKFERRSIQPDCLDQLAFADLMFFRDDILRANRIGGNNFLTDFLFNLYPFYSNFGRGGGCIPFHILDSSSEKNSRFCCRSIAKTISIQTIPNSNN